MTGETARRAPRTLPEWRRIAEALPAIVWAARPDGSAIFFNRRWYEYTGLAPEAPLGDTWIGALHPDDVERTVATWSGCVRTGAPNEIQYAFAAATGRFAGF